MDLKKIFKEKFPKVYYLENDIPGLKEYLINNKWMLEGEEILTLEKPGEGNMNFLLRVKTTHRSLIIKQSRPFVQKYPQIEAPIERILIEAQFIRIVTKINSIKDYSPKIIGFDEASYLLLMEDLGQGTDYSYLYQDGQQINDSEISSLTNYIGKLHNSKEAAVLPISNMSMRQLNHEHIFHFPFVMNNGFNLDSVQDGLQEASISYKMDSELKKRVTALGEIYLSEDEGNSLLHGDYYPGSWLKVDSGIKVIDPEFGFIGRAEFDLGVFIAHLALSNQGNATIKQVLREYKKPSGFDAKLLSGFAATEILRRLIGVAQLPLELSLNDKISIMNRATQWLTKEKFDF